MEASPVARQLESAPDKPLRFLLYGEQLIPNDFHVTEIKRVTVESLDCGGGASTWKELVVQLWSPKGNNTQTAMHAAKFSSILARAGALDLLGSDPLRFEYGDAGSPAVQYHFERIDSTGETVDVYLMPPHVTCKPHERAQLAELSMVQNDPCCAPTATGACCG